MKTADFDYNLPEELIAQEAVEPRDSSRLLHLERKTGQVCHKGFRNILDLLHQGDRLIFNNTKVLPARVRAKKSTGAEVELLFTERIDDYHWLAMVRPGKRLKPGAKVIIDKTSGAGVEIKEIADGGARVIEMSHSGPYNSIESLMQEYGDMPLPPYIERKARIDDKQRYQTVYAKQPGAIAAPTAGLHFTLELLDSLKAKGIDISYVTLHVGAGTFKPVKEDDPRDHDMHVEHFELQQKIVDEIETTRKSGGRVIAVGTTVVRVLEHCARLPSGLKATTGSTRLLILPPYHFRVIDGLITNFHLPRSTLLMLVSAFAGTQNVLNAYKAAVERRYRFFSYGDAMLIV